MERTAVIVGAGIGGLAAGVALRRAGWRVHVVERAHRPGELGFALLLAPNAMRALQELGVADVVMAGGVMTTSGEMRRPDGRVLRRLDVATINARLPAPTVTVLRPVLHGSLLASLGADSIRLGEEATDVSSTAAGPVLVLRSGETIRADMLIGADGVRSAVRRVLHPNEGPATPSGLLALRGVVHGAAQELGSASGAQYFGRGIEAGLARASGDAVYWYMSIPQRTAPTTRDPIIVLHAFIRTFHEPFRRIVLATAPEDIRLDDLYDRDPLAQWGTGAVTLLGDAAHPMLPHAGQGAAQALEDAVALGRAVTRYADVPVALRRYEHVRAKRTRDFIALSRRNARLGSLTHPLACWLRDGVLRTIPDRLILRSIIALNRPPEDDI